MRSRSLTALATTTAPTLRALATAAVCAMTTQCSQVIGLNEYYDCPGDSRCPADVLCHDGQKNGDESDVDCGGPCSTKCADGKGCVHDDDCESQSCGAGVCASCSDGKKNGKETDVDCGGACTSKCGDGKACVVDGDCASGSCAAGTCASCSDGKKNGKETDVDCGGACSTKCADGKACVADGDCASGSCSAGVCASCSDGKKNGEETDVDCGGTCTTKCADGKTCVVDGDCASGSCGAGVCASCSDGKKNGKETDVDCGGTCTTKCADGKVCAVDGDCMSGSCLAGTCAPGTPCQFDSDCPKPVNECLVAICASGHCGTGNTPSGFGVAAQTQGDCHKVVCDGKGATTVVVDDTDVPSDGKQCTADSCNNGQPVFTLIAGACNENGGKVCADIATINAGSCVACTVASQATDCPGQACLEGVCVPTHCTSGAMDVDETDVDCGGSCPPCIIGEKCVLTADCTSSTCNAGFCNAPAIATSTHSVVALVVDAAYVYWNAGNAIAKGPLGGGTATVLATTSNGLATYDGIAIDSTNLYWGDVGGGVGYGSIFAVPLGGGMPVTLASGQSLSKGATVRLVADGKSVYWGAGSEILVTLASGGTPASFVSGLGGVLSMAIDSTSVYWTDGGAATVMKASIAGGAPTTLATGQIGPQGVAVDAQHVYWGNNDDGSMWVAPIDGGAPTPLIPATASLGTPQITLIDGAFAYVLMDGAVIVKVLLSNGAQKRIAKGSLGGLAQDADYLYWGTRLINGGPIIKVHK